MARKKRKTAVAARRAKKKIKASSPAGKKPRTLEEMLDRVPDKEYLSTREVQHVFELKWEGTVSRWLTAGDLKAYRRRGKANIFKREDVIALIESRFEIRPAPISEIREKASAARDHKAAKVAKSKPRKTAKKVQRKTRPR